MRALQLAQLLFAVAVFNTSAQPHNGTLAGAPPTTSVTDSLNKQMESAWDRHQHNKGIYTGGQGVMVRTPDFFSGGQQTVVPASLWVNDIWTPNSLYPSFNPWCPHQGTDGYFDLSWVDCEVSNEGPWKYATVAAVVGEQGMSEMFSNFKDIQSATWGYGVFYAADANSADKRCRNIADKKGFDCPGYWLAYDGTKVADPSKKGSGFYSAGNPYAGGGGGGTGCHFDKTQNAIDQTDAWTTSGLNLVQDSDCQCNYIFNDDWSHWVDNWILNAKQKAGFEKRAWLGGNTGKAPQWGVDVAMCWMNNPRDMIKLQNQLWVQHNQWLNGVAPHWNSATPNPSEYWGWNEIPVPRSVMDNFQKWDTIVIKLPPGFTTVNMLGAPAQKQLQSDLQTWQTKGKLQPGFGNAGKRPGSYVVFATELEWHGGCPGETSTHSAHCFKRNFYCENWTPPQSKFQVKYVAKNSGNSAGCCYVDYQKSKDLVEEQTMV